MRSLRLSVRCGAAVVCVLAFAGLNAGGRDALAQKPKAAVQIPDADKRGAWKAYSALTTTMCAKRHVQLAPAAMMNLHVQDFEAHELSPLQNRQFQEVAALACLNVPGGGAGCANTGLLVAAQRGGYLPRFANAMCRTGIQCTAKGKCVEK